MEEIINVLEVYAGVEISSVDCNGFVRYYANGGVAGFDTIAEVKMYIDNNLWKYKIHELYKIQEQRKELEKQENEIKRIIKKNMYDEGKSEILVDDIKCSYRMDISHRTDKKSLNEALKTIDKNLEEFQIDSIKEVLTLKKLR